MLDVKQNMLFNVALLALGRPENPMRSIIVSSGDRVLYSFAVVGSVFRTIARLV